MFVCVKKIRLIDFVCKVTKNICSNSENNWSKKFCKNMPVGGKTGGKSEKTQ